MAAAGPTASSPSPHASTDQLCPGVCVQTGLLPPGLAPNTGESLLLSGSSYVPLYMGLQTGVIPG